MSGKKYILIHSDENGIDTEIFEKEEDAEESMKNQIDSLINDSGPLKHSGGLVFWDKIQKLKNDGVLILENSRANIKISYRVRNFPYVENWQIVEI